MYQSQCSCLGAVFEPIRHPNSALPSASVLRRWFFSTPSVRVGRVGGRRTRLTVVAGALRARPGADPAAAAQGPAMWSKEEGTTDGVKQGETEKTPRHRGVFRSISPEVDGMVPLKNGCFLGYKLKG